MGSVNCVSRLVWHGKGGKAVARLKALDDMLLTKVGYEFSTLWWNLRTVSRYIRNNTHTLVNYGARFRKGLPIPQQHRRVGGEPGCEPLNGEAAADALDRRRGPLPGAGASRRPQWRAFAVETDCPDEGLAGNLTTRARPCVGEPLGWLTATICLPRFGSLSRASST